MQNTALQQTFRGLGLIYGKQGSKANKTAAESSVVDLLSLADKR